jgi:2-polyprenyl-6-methoxyphenol hydroxylase-like FAD-dependent oxidoreductase
MKKLAIAAALLPLAALAAEGSKPGMYAYTVKMEMPGMPFAMPAQNFQRCLTQADVDKGKQYDNQSDRGKDCEVKNLKQSAGKATFDLACKDGTTGTAEYTSTADGMAGKTVMHMKDQPQAMTMNMTAKRTGDCN